LCSGFSPVLFPFRKFSYRLVHYVIHPWIAALWRPCLASGYCFIGKVCLEGAGFLTELTELTKLADHQEVGSWRAAVRLLLSDTLVSSVLSVSFDSLVPAQLALWANLWLLHHKEPVFSIVVNSTVFNQPDWGGVEIPRPNTSVTLIFS
jgi:hypothetical protein